ncbi:MAG: amino acid adenylation domain-containing protein [Planctomycetota bacterium]
MDITKLPTAPTSSVAGTPAATRATYASTEAQLEIWLSSQQSRESNCGYNEITSLELRGELDAKALESAIGMVMARHESLRSTFLEDGRSVVVHESVKPDVRCVDWCGCVDVDLDREHAELIRREGCEPFDLNRGPLIRFVLQIFGKDHHRLTMTSHHIVLDGWSLAVLCRDLGHFYDELTGRSPPELPAADLYRDYALAMADYERSEQHATDLAFWGDQFRDGFPTLDTPCESRRPSLKTFCSDRHDHVLDRELVEQLRQLGTQQGCSLFNTMLAAFTVYVSRLIGSGDVCIGIPTAGQAALDQRDLVGYCVNTLPFRTTVDGSASFADYLRLTRTRLLNALEHQRVSFGELLRVLSPPRDPSRSPVIDISFNVDPFIDANELGFEALDVDVRVEPRCYEKFEWFINGVIHRNQAIELQVQYNTDLYSRNAVEFYFEGFEAFLRGLTTDSGRCIRDHHVMSIPQRQRVIADWNQTELDYPDQATLHQEFIRQSLETPDRIAVEFEGRSLTYAEVDSRSNQLARGLQNRGVASGDLVGVCVERSEQLLEILLAVLKTGAGYVPLDPAYPSDRLRHMCEHSGLSLVVTQSNLAAVLGDFGGDQLPYDLGTSEFDALDSSPIRVDVQPNDVCYVIYTSGSTGKPKGVQVPHGAVVNFLYSMRSEPGFALEDSILAVTTLSFDISVLELFLPIISGGRVIVLDSVTAANGEQLADHIDRHDVSHLQATPATWRLLIQSGWQGKSDLKVLCGGEPMPRELVAPLLDRCGELWNMYGPTETTVWSAIHRVTDPEAPILIGRPIGNTQIYLLDENGNEVACGCEGEIHIGGAGVTLGYRNQPDVTHERFVRNRYRNPFASYANDRLYRTGDIARCRFDGNVEFLRRNDKQVKVRGHRIELGEIEQALLTHPAVQEAVVVVREDSPGDARLVAYWVANLVQPSPESDHRDHLRRTLPGYMIPQHFIQLATIPQTNNGKVDFQQLPTPRSAGARTPQASQAQDFTPSEAYLVGICRVALEHEDVVLDDTFFDAGGHSLLVMGLISRIDDELGFRFGPQDFLVNTIRQLAERLPHKDHSAQEMNTDTQSVAANVPLPVPAESKEPVDAETSDESKRERFLATLQGFWE